MLFYFYFFGDGGEGSWYLSVFHLVSGKRANRNSNLYLVSTLENENIFVLFFFSTESTIARYQIA